MALKPAIAFFQHVAEPMLCWRLQEGCVGLLFGVL